MIKRFKKQFKQLSLSIFIACSFASSMLSKQKQVIQKNVILDHYNLYKKQPQQAPMQKPPTITIWIHGTQSSKKWLKPLRDFANRPYKILKKDELPYFHSEPGLIAAPHLNDKCYLRYIAETICQSNPIQFPIDSFYLFGWSGKLCFDQRQKAAQDLYDKLTTVINNYKKQYAITPKIRIITHSHGGNVALNLASIKDPNYPNDFSIAELVLLACPVQEETKSLIKDPLFEKVYSLYSRADLIQILDPQGIYKNQWAGKVFSERRFPHQDNLVQVSLRVNNNCLWHISFLRNYFVCRLPAILETIDQWNQEYPESPSQRKQLWIYI